MHTDHVNKRETALGRWFPLSFYVVHLALWIVTGMQAGAWDLVWLSIVPLPALGIYVLRTRKASK